MPDPKLFNAQANDYSFDSVRAPPIGRHLALNPRAAGADQTDNYADNKSNRTNKQTNKRSAAPSCADAAWAVRRKAA